MRDQFLNWGIAILALVWFMSVLMGGGWWLPLILTIIYVIGVYNTFQKESTILRNFPVVGYLRYFFEGISPEMQEYFTEGNTDGKPFSKNERFQAYKRAKNHSSHVSFGTQLELNRPGNLAIKHSSFFAQQPTEKLPLVSIGGPQCQQVFKTSLFNIAAMSFGALSGRAIMALNIGAKRGGFYQNTGEGGISQYHLQGGNLCWQIGTGYYGCRDRNGNFSYELFAEKSVNDYVKMIEIKLSQGAQPGQGGVLPAVKNTLEIAKLRHVEPGIEIQSPPTHSAFSGIEGLLEFIYQLRELSGGKPIGIKMCIGDEDEFRMLCEKMVATNILPDFITIDGAEGGTGAAPLDFSNYVGLPLRPALTMANTMLKKFNLRDKISLIACGKIIKPIDIIEMLSLGADVCNSARGFMFSLGCIQALRCHTNKCPVGITTQNKMLIKGLNVTDKSDRVYYFHRNTLLACNQLLAATGRKDYSEIDSSIFIKE